MPTKTKVDVAIVGGGPGGLAAAHAIHAARPDLQVRIYERSSSMRPQGNVFSLFPNGQSALKAINPAIVEELRESAIDFAGLRSTDFDTVEELPPPHKMLSQAFGFDTDQVLLLAWFVLRDTLASMLPEGQLQLGRTLSDVELQNSGTAQLIFLNTDEVVEAKVVIGCDGNKSTVRNCTLQDGDPRLMDSVIARGILDAPDDWPHQKGFLCAFNSQESRSQMLASYLVKGTELFGWNSLLPSDVVPDGDIARSYHGGNGGVDSELKDKWLKALEAWPEYLRNLVEKTPCSQITLHRQTYREPEDITKWGMGCVTLLGDSAHLATPALGMGVSMAVEDAVELGRAIGELGPTEAALRKYEEVRMPRVAKVHEASVKVFRQVVGGETDKKFGRMQMEWHMGNPWCAGATFEPIVAAKMAST